jgi:hypothetical protein
VTATPEPGTEDPGDGPDGVGESRVGSARTGFRPVGITGRATRRRLHDGTSDSRRPPDLRAARGLGPDDPPGHVSFAAGAAPQKIVNPPSVL